MSPSNVSGVRVTSTKAKKIEKKPLVLKTGPVVNNQENIPNDAVAAAAGGGGLKSTAPGKLINYLCVFEFLFELFYFKF